MKRSPLKLAKDKAWKKCSEYIRKKYADENGMVKCVTCGVIKPWKEMQAGHFIDGRGNSILFEEKGIHPQCYACNCMKHGNKVEYFKYMELNYGRAVIDELCILSKKPLKFTVDYLKAIEDDFQVKINLIGVE